MNKKLFVYKIALLLLFISSLHPWFVWNIQGIFISFVAACCMLIARGSRAFEITRKSFSISLIYLVFVLWVNRGVNVFGLAEQFINWFVFLAILSTNDTVKQDALNFITKYTAILLMISLPFFALHVMGLSLPHESVTSINSLSSLDNYYFFVTKGYIPRFQGPFLEPGFMTMGIAPLLFLNKYNLKNKWVAILFISQMMSLSIAGYVLLVVGYFFVILFGNKKKKFSRVLVAILALAASVFVLTKLFGQEVIDESIIGRLQWENGKLSGDNRSSDYLDIMYDKVIGSDLKWIGTEWDSEMSEKGVAGYKLFIVKYGYIGLLLVISLYFSSAIVYKTGNKWQWFLIFFLLIMLYQNAYPAMWAVLITLFYGNELLTKTDE